MNLLINFWTFDLVSMLVVSGLGLGYGYLSGWRLKPGAGLYFSGVVLVLLVQTSPLHYLGMYYLLSAHMAGHMLLLLVAAPLLVLGLPSQTDSGKSWKAISVFFRQKPWFGWLLCLVTMWFWHIPLVHDLMVSRPAAATIPLCTLTGTAENPLANLLHIIQPVSLLVAGVCFAWPILGPMPSYRVHPLMGVGYLFTACVGCSLLGMLITFAPVGVYQVYGGPDYFGIAHQLNTDWNLNRSTDQQLAGLLMWVPGCFIYLSGVLYLLINWLGEKQPVAWAIESNVQTGHRTLGKE
ncbi:cytochrome c oxidase assembly protein [Spirosoma spitsbergense]|uniref:cytochrome c oxidase assembly protein n=1 Tax=Spirosoma spitsbergense TaxID=431554 RepID=UPI00036D2E08|nr:cytochrome c oxidase assembly protein [Spirosoma spitsbergense]